MINNELNSLPKKIKNGEISIKDAVNTVCSYISNNYPIFGLHKYDEDFREDIILYFLERGEHIFKLYNPETADFFTFLYSNIISYINTKRRSLARSNLREKLTTAESINNFDDKENAYANINYQSFEMSQVPYAYKPISVNELQKIFKPLSNDQSDKKILVLAMKSSFFISHEQIKKVSVLYNIQIDDMYKTIEYCKDSITKRASKHNLILERRNFAYFQHKRCEHELMILNSKDEGKELIDNLIKKNNKHLKSMNLINLKFESGFLHLRPTNKTIADILGICERQVTYYLNCAKKDCEKMKKELSAQVQL